MDLSNETILKFLVAAGALAFILLLVSFQFIFAIVVLIVTIASYVFLKQQQQT